MNSPKSKKKQTTHKHGVWRESKEPTIVVVRMSGKNFRCYCIHRETFLRNPETTECLRMEAWYDVSLWPNFVRLERNETHEYTLVFPALPAHWQTFDLWEMKGTGPHYVSGIGRNTSGVYIINLH